MRPSLTESGNVDEKAEATPAAVPIPTSTGVVGELELEDINLMDYWSRIEDKLAPPEEPLREQTIHELDLNTVEFPDFHAVQTVFVDESKDLSVTVTRIPENVVKEQQEKIEEARWREQQKLIESMKRQILVPCPT